MRLEQNFLAILKPPGRESKALKLLWVKNTGYLQKRFGKGNMCPQPAIPVYLFYLVRGTIKDNRELELHP